MPTLSTSIKQEIYSILEGLARKGTLGSVQMDDFKLGIFDRDYGKFPVAVLTTPSIEGAVLTNRQNTRTHTFEIIILQNAENVTSADEIETLVETILDEFDNNITLNGKADGAVEPAATQPEPVVSRGKTYIVFSITLRARAIKDLTF